MTHFFLHIYLLLVLSVLSDGKLSKALIRKGLDKLRDSGIQLKYPNVPQHPDTHKSGRGTAIPVMTVVSIDIN